LAQGPQVQVFVLRFEAAPVPRTCKRPLVNMTLNSMVQGPLVQDLQDQVMHGLKVAWEITQEKAQAGYGSAKERVDTARVGQSLLQSGGTATEVALGAKLASIEAAARDSDILQRVSAAIAAFDDSAAKLRMTNSASQDLPQGIGGVQDFEALAEAYEARARTYRQLLEGLVVLPPVPEMSLAEHDAAMILQVKGHCQLAAQKTSESCAAITKKAKEAVVGSSNLETCGRATCL